MFPIRDHNPSERVPYVCYALIAINTLIFLYDFTVLQSDAAKFAFFDQYALIPAKLSEGTGYSGLLTHMFLHGGFMHAAGNMLFLFIFGDNLEDAMGRLGFLGFYLLSGLAAASAQIFASPLSDIPMVGASGAIAGVMGGYLLLFPKARVDILVIIVIILRIFPVPAWVMLGLWFAIQIVAGIATPADVGGVAYWAHAGGFAVGLALTIPIWLARGCADFWRRTDGHPPHPDATYRFQRSRVPKVRRR